ncbi:MAG: hypothetical protein ABJ382_12425, partial [Ilumatobacter sp.]
VSEAAVLIDGRELLLDEHVRTVLTRRNEPTTIVRAPEGMLGALPPLISDETVEAFPDHRWTTVPGTNHYTLLLGVDGASAIAAAIRNELAA